MSRERQFPIENRNPENDSVKINCLGSHLCSLGLAVQKTPRGVVRNSCTICGSQRIQTLHIGSADVSSLTERVSTKSYLLFID